jgi:alkanesulfonate monooxygenase SsuD/methylene tetrahydromethanopterin reductase-like flavin-dependent oxidoreductase (luciferase family)
MPTPRGFGIAVSVDESVIAPTATRAEDLGYSSFWTNNSPGTDGLQVLRIAGDATSSINLGVGVIPVLRHPPEEVVQRAGKGTDRELPLDRLLLGIGTSGKGALQAARENVEKLRSELGCKVYLAALGPKMCRLAGEVADGVLFNWLTPDFARQSADIVREGAASAGRPAPRIMTYVRVSLREDGLEKLKKEAARYEAIPQYAAHFERMGVGGVDASIAANDAREIQDRLREWDGVLDEIVVRSITPDDSQEQLVELVEAAKPVGIQAG